MLRYVTNYVMKSLTIEQVKDDDELATNLQP
jgi:hypothetical protein